MCASVMYLTSAKLPGKSETNAPPNRGLVAKSDMTLACGRCAVRMQQVFNI